MGFCTFVGAEWCGSSEAHDTALVARVEPPWYPARPPSWCSRSRGRGRADSAASNLTAVIIDVTAAAEPRKLHGGRPSRPLCGAERYPPDHRSGRVPAAAPQQISGQPGHRPASVTHRVTTIDPFTSWRPLVCGRVNATKDDITPQTWHGESGCVPFGACARARDDPRETSRSQLRRGSGRQTHPPRRLPRVRANERNHRYDEHSECQP